MKYAVTVNAAVSRSVQIGWIDNKLEQAVISLVPVRQVWKLKWRFNVYVISWIQTNVMVGKASPKEKYSANLWKAFIKTAKSVPLRNLLFNKAGCTKRHYDERTYYSNVKTINII